MAALLLLAAMPALSEVRSDQALAPVIYGAAAPRQESARVASDGTNFFAAWRTRTASNTFVIGGGRISPDGELLDRPSILFAVGSAIGSPDVVFVGGNFLVVYQSGTSVVTRRFSRDGRPVDSEAATISNTAIVAPLATNGKSVLLPTARNRFLLLAPDGTPLGPERDIPNAGSTSMSVASNGERYLIANADSADGSGQGTYSIVDAKGDLLLSHSIQLPEQLSPRSVTAASNGLGFLLVVVTNGPVGCQYVDATTGIATALRTLNNQPAGVVVASWTGGEYTLVWPRMLSRTTSSASDDIGAARVDAAGVPIDSAPVTIASVQNARYGVAFAGAWNGRDTLIITGDVGDVDGDYKDWHTTATIFKSLPQIDTEPANRRHAAIASSAAEQASGSIASNGTLSLMTWRESTGLDRSIVRAAIVAADGELGSPIDLGQASPQTTTAAASNGRDFLVAYYDARWRLVARRVTLEGLADSDPIVISDYGFPTDAFAASWSGQAYVLATTGYSFVTVSGISANGSDARDRQLIPSYRPADSPAVLCAANGCSVTWHWADLPCYNLCDPTASDVFARTDAAGTLVAQVLLTDILSVTPALLLPASDGQSVFVYSNGKNMFAGRITATGVVLDTPAVNGGRHIITSETSFALQPVAVVNSGLYFVEPDSYANGRLYWTRIEPEPAPHATSLIDLHQSVSLSAPLTLTASARNTYLVYSRGDDDATLMAPRLFLRTLASPDPQSSPGRRHAAR